MRDFRFSYYYNAPSLATRLTGDYRDRTFTGKCGPASLNTQYKKRTQPHKRLCPLPKPYLFHNKVHHTVRYIDLFYDCTCQFISNSFFSFCDCIFFGNVNRDTDDCTGFSVDLYLWQGQVWPFAASFSPSPSSGAGRSERGQTKKPAYAVLHGRLCIRRPGLFGVYSVFSAAAGWAQASDRQSGASHPAHG